MLECSEIDCKVFTERFRLCAECKPLPNIYCLGGAGHWSGIKEGHASEGLGITPDANIGSKKCIICSMEIGPLGFGNAFFLLHSIIEETLIFLIKCSEDNYYLCISCLISGEDYYTGESM
jgi:hypothetical protein